MLGLDPARHADRLRRRTGAQHQSSALPDRLWVAEAVRLFARIQRRDVDVAAVLAQWDLADLRRRPYGALSGGQRQRVLLAFAGIGVLLGSLLPGPRAAQGLGLLLFFGTFFVAGGGPPPGLLPDILNDVAALTPIGLLVDAIRAPWSGEGLDAGATVALAGIAVAGIALAGRRLARI